MYQIEVLNRGGQWTTEGLGDANEFDTEEEATAGLEEMLAAGIWKISGDGSVDEYGDDECDDWVSGSDYSDEWRVVEIESATR
jgi:hypothetical protein